MTDPLTPEAIAEATAAAQWSAAWERQRAARELRWHRWIASACIILLTLLAALLMFGVIKELL